MEILKTKKYRPISLRFGVQLATDKKLSVPKFETHGTFLLSKMLC